MTAANKRIALNDDTGFIKIIAIITMIIDHLGAAVFPGQTWMRIVGRISFPLFAYCIAVGSIYTKNAGKYALRIFILAIISQPIYCIALNHMNANMYAVSFTPFTISAALNWFWYSLRVMNILFTLCIGILLIWSIRDEKFIFTGALVLLVWLLRNNLSYGYRGIALMLLFYAFIDRPVTSFVWIAGYMLWWGITQGGSYSFMNVRFSSQTFAVMALPFIYIKTSTGIKGSKWLFYLLYPVHLVLLYAVDYFINR
ncbi:MAG: TraX family protein [Clostridia bacterium]|nr:TraX family protein [Clostridia bacterium]